MEISLQELQGLILSSKNHEDHPLRDKYVLAVSTNGFIHAGTLRQCSSYLYLEDAVNVRYWGNRDGGLPELAEQGFVEEDKIDKCHSDIWLSSLVFMQEMNK